MTATTLECPHCRGVLKTGLGPQNLLGRRIKCRKCGQRFVASQGLLLHSGSRTFLHDDSVPVAAPAGAKAVTADAPEPALEPPPFDFPEADEAVSVPSVRRRERSALPLLLTLCAGLVLLGGAVLAGVLLWPQSPAPAALTRLDDLPPELPVPVEADRPRPAAPDNPSPAGPDPVGGGAAPVPPDSSARSTLPPEQQRRVNDAVERGMRYVRGQQTRNGTWTPDRSIRTYALACTALPALTLLECGVPAADPNLRKAADYVRREAPKEDQTYSLALAILFLDRLGDPRDDSLIRQLALRLIGGQLGSGGWTYACKSLNKGADEALLNFLRRTRPQPLPNPLARGDGAMLPVALAGDEPGRINPAVANPDEDGKRLTLPFPEPGTKPRPGGNGGRLPDFRAGGPRDQLDRRIRDLPVVRYAPSLQTRPTGKLPEDNADNSNTQFALMALWAARRHGVPVERTMALVDHRFRTSQQRDGYWPYRVGRPDNRPSMICVGLIGLAMGHGSYKEAVEGATGQTLTAARSDPLIEDAFKALSAKVQDAPADRNANAPGVDLYFLWSVERVAVLYNLAEIGGKDWYGWAAHTLVKNQRADGSWRDGKYYHDTELINTCLALLVLKRANLTHDLTQSLRLYIPIGEPARRER